MGTNRLAIIAFCFVPVALAQNTFWPTSAVPTLKSVTNDSVPVTLGLPFYSSVAGKVIGGRFYKGSNNPGPHVIALYDAAGNKLAQSTVQNETATGWQTATFSAPVPIVPQNRYVIAYFAPRGGYADDQNYAWSTISRPPLHVGSLNNTASSGTFAYGYSVTFPTGTWDRSNYWVDVLFQQGSVAPPPVVTPTAHSVTLNWTASTSSMIQGYNIYRGTTSGGPYGKINVGLISGTSYLDSAVSSGSTYYYVSTAVDATGAESGYSNQAVAIIPIP